MQHTEYRAAQKVGAIGRDRSQLHHQVLVGVQLGRHPLTDIDALCRHRRERGCSVGPLHHKDLRRRLACHHRPRHPLSAHSRLQCSGHDALPRLQSLRQLRHVAQQPWSCLLPLERPQRQGTQATAQQLFIVDQVLRTLLLQGAGTSPHLERSGESAP